MIYGRELDCLRPDDAPAARPVHAVRPDTLQPWLARLPAAAASFVRDTGFAAQPGRVCLLPSEAGLGAAVLGLGAEAGPHVFGALPGALPPGTTWRIGDGVEDPAEFILGFCLGAYRFDACKQAASAGDTQPGSALLAASPDLLRQESVARSLAAARAAWLARDLINTPANRLGPAELAGAAESILSRNGAHANVMAGASLAEMYPALHAVGRGSSRPAAVVVAKWQSASANSGSPRISICGKGVCFDTGGYDLKPSAGMLRMKKDMAGAAIALGLACMIIEADLPCQLELRLGCVENMISGDAMRPLDVLNTRKGLSVEVGNTDAEGRLVLCDLLTEACESSPAMLIDFATLTGAARVALGPDVPALFSNDDVLADVFTSTGQEVHDPVWRLPLWSGYNYWLESNTGDLNNVTEKSYAGAIVAALFLQRFVCSGTRWAHFDVYGWNDTTRPGRPIGGEAQAMRAAFEGIRRFISNWEQH